METIDNNNIKDIIIMVLRSPFVVVVGIFFGEVFFSIFLSTNVFGCFGLNPSDPMPAELVTFGAASFAASQNFANRFGSHRKVVSFERRHWLVGWVSAVLSMCVSWLVVVVG